MELIGMAPNRKGYEHALLMYGNNRMWRETLATLDSMWDNACNPDQQSYQLACSSCEDSAAFERADVLRQQMHSIMRVVERDEEMREKMMVAPFEREGAEAPKAEPAPWRLPGTEAITAYDPHKSHPSYKKAITKRRDSWDRQRKKDKLEGYFNQEAYNVDPNMQRNRDGKMGTYYDRKNRKGMAASRMRSGYSDRNSDRKRQ